MTVINLANQDLTALLEDSQADILMLDVRTPMEYEALGHIPGARLLPIHELPEQLGTLNPDQATVVICEHGIRSADASHYLAYHGFKQVYHLATGMAEWNGPRTFSSENSG